MTRTCRTHRYEPPTLTCLGDVWTLTGGCDKTWGASDGFTFQGVPITCTSG